MPTYLCHGFRWHRLSIRIFIIIHDLEDAAPDWIIGFDSTSVILDQLYENFDFLPELPVAVDSSDETVLADQGGLEAPAKDGNTENGDFHQDEDMSLPPPRVPDSEDAILMHQWSAVKLLEEYDVAETAVAARPYAYVADYVTRIDLSADVAAEMAKYDALSKSGGEKSSWFVQLRDKIQPGEDIKWYVVVCDDPERAAPEELLSEDEKMSDIGETPVMEISPTPTGEVKEVAMASAQQRRQHYSPSPVRSDPSSFAQTGAEFTLDDDDNDDGDDRSDDDDLRSAVLDGGSSAHEAYELADRRPYKEHGDDERLPLSRRLSASSVASFQLYTPDEELAVRRKFDRKLVLFVALLFMLSFLDRSNIGNAFIAGMDADLQTNPPRDDWYEWTLTSFYISYIAFEWMSLLWKLVPAHIYVSLIVLTWGLTASLQSVAVSYPMLIALRVLLGIGEAGFTGIPFYLSFFFKRDELAFRTAIFISAAPLATSFASTLAWVIVKFASISPIAPWRLLFLVEGFPSVIVSVIAWNVIPDSPQTAPYLTRREKKVARLRLRNEKPTGASAATPSSSSKLKGRELLAVIRDPIAWITAAMFFLTNMAYSSLPVFLPKIMTEMGHSTLASQALSAPPYLVAFVVVLFTAHMSDRLRARTVPIVFHALASAAGYGILAISEVLHIPAFVRYIAIYPAAIGFFNVVTLTIAWNINNQASESRQSGGFAILQFVGQCGPLVGTRLYPEKDAPYYSRGMLTCALAMLAVAILAMLLRLYLQYQNRRMDREESQSQDHATAVEEEGLVARRNSSRTAERFRYMI
ncbi:MFS transporter prlL [Paramyrothecium foliicola]|nr:MFS transporter prlL [Paramyrothecium foliicola]